MISENSLIASPFFAWNNVIAWKPWRHKPGGDEMWWVRRARYSDRINAIQKRFLGYL